LRVTVLYDAHHSLITLIDLSSNNNYCKWELTNYPRAFKRKSM